jgi:hypothetical protein
MGKVPSIFHGLSGLPDEGRLYLDGELVGTATQKPSFRQRVVDASGREFPSLALPATGLTGKSRHGGIGCH